MKLVLAIALFAMSSMSFAAHHKTLAEYDASYAYNVQWPQIPFNEAVVPVKNICVEGETFKTVNPVKICTKTAVVEVCKETRESEICRKVRAGETPKENSRTRLVYGCVASEMRSLEVSRFHEVTVCSEWKRNPAHQGKDSSEPAWICVAHETSTKEYADNYDVTVLTNGSNDRDDRVVATINFALPVCK